MKVRLRRSAWVAAVVSTFIVVSVLPAVAAGSPTPSLTPGPTYTVWAYGAVRTVDFSGPATSDYDYMGSATYGYAVILNQTNLTSSTFELFANRTMAVDLSIEYCSPNCKKPTLTATVSHDVWEAVDSWANFTTNASVIQSGANASAVGLLNSHTEVHGSLLDEAQGLVRDSVLSANVSADASVTFSPALGLLPNDLSAPSSWTSSSAFSASGDYLIGYHYHFVGPHATINIGPTTTSGSVSGTGNVSVSGSVSSGAPSSIDLGGVPYVNVSLSVVGPFEAREGFILVPDTVDLFGSSASSAWSANETGGATASMSSLDVRPGGAHLGIGGSEWLFTSMALNPSVTSLAPEGPGVTEIAAGANDVGTTPVQGVPMAVGQAQSDQGCLISGGTCASPAGKGPAPVFLLGLLGAAVLAAVLVVAVTERRRMPPPVYPNATLYPPGASAPAKDTATTGPVRRPAPAEDDPLSNLW